jgi:DNA-binding PadR family transcriptional regulator
MGELSRITPATLDVLDVLLDEDVEHYGLAIARKAGLATGSTFPILARLERIGWVTSFWEETEAASRGPRRRFYRLTPEGMARARALVVERRSRGIWWADPLPGGAV